VGKPDKTTWRASYRQADNIKEDLKEVGREGVDWIELACDRYRWWALVNTVISLWFL
jgi:hypothetical protein